MKNFVFVPDSIRNSWLMPCRTDGSCVAPFQYNPARKIPRRTAGSRPVTDTPCRKHAMPRTRALRRLIFFCFLGLLFFVRGVFALVPIQEKSLQGAAAAEARQKVLSAAESYLGVPYRYAGINRNGMDCSGLVYASFREALGITIPRIAEDIYSWAEKIDTKELAPGDLVFFVTAGAAVSHVGIYAGENRFIHSASEGPQTGVMYSRLDEAYWRRAYKGAGRALPWDEEAARAMTAARTGNIPAGFSGSPASTEAAGSVPVWSDSGFFANFGAAWTWGGFFEGTPSVFRGIAGFAGAGYRWTKYRAGLELRPEWDRALGVFRLPFTVSFGTDMFQVFAGPAYTFGEPALSLEDGERHYAGGGEWLWEAGLSLASPAVQLGRGAFALYGELAWQPYFLEDGAHFLFRPDITANFRASTGLRYLWHL